MAQHVRTTRVKLADSAPRAVEITDDEARCTYVVAVTQGEDGGPPRLAHLRITPHEGHEPPAQVPWRALTLVAARHLGIIRERRTPDVAEVARVATEATGQGVSARHELARVFGVSVNTADTWLRAARDAGLVKRASTGRPRKDDK